MTRQCGGRCSSSASFPVLAKPVFLTGDINATSKPFCAMTHDGLMTAANGGRAGSACHVPQGAGIDWIFGNRATGFDDYTVDRGTLVRRTTDHPIVPHAGRVVR